MPRRSSLLLGIALLLAGCSASTTSPASHAAAPTAQPTQSFIQNTGPGGWSEQLTFSGDLSATATATAPDDNALKSECTAANSRRSGTWASTLVVNLKGTRFALVVLAHNYTFPATYTDDVTVELHSADLSRIYLTQPGDPTSFSVDADETSGHLDATLSNAQDATKKLKVTGAWTCRP